jgi:tetratricopeptide (TPR) repeat protein
VRLQLGDYKGSAEAFEACLEKKKNWPEAQLNAGLAYWKMGDMAQARAAFEKILAMEPSSVEALRGLAGIALQSGETTEALRLHHELIKKGHRTPELLYNTGLLLQKSEDHNDLVLRFYEWAGKTGDVRGRASETSRI